MRPFYENHLEQSEYFHPKINEFYRKIKTKILQIRPVVYNVQQSDIYSAGVLILKLLASHSRSDNVNQCIADLGRMYDKAKLDQ